MLHESWYQGTADAVRRNIPYFTEERNDLVLILSGDQLYRMDFRDMIRTHRETKAEITIAALPERVTQRKAEPLVSTRTPPNPTLEAVERAYILWVLQSEGGNKSRAAEVLGIDPSTLYRKLSRYGVEAA